jgi:hypothetical protein
VDSYAGYNRLIAPDRVSPDIRLASCWAHARRKLVEITRTGSAPIAEEGVKRIAELYRIEVELRGLGLVNSGNTQCQRPTAAPARCHRLAK